MVIKGTHNNDVLDGTPGDDTFNIKQGGNDTVTGDDGDDTVQAGDTLTAADSIDGGADTDQVVLKGDYSAGLVFGANTITNVEILRLASGHDYNLTMNDGNVAAGATLSVNAGPLNSAHHLVFDGSAEQDGHFTVYGGRGSDTITGGAQSDALYLGRGGIDTAHGSGGDDTIEAVGSLTAADTIDGGTGNDRLILNGNYAANVTFGAATMTNIETLRVAGSHNYNLTLNNANLAAGQTLMVNAGPLGAGNHLTFSGAAETDGHFVFFGSGGDDAITGGALSDRFSLKAGGNDTAHGGGGDDTFDLASDFTTTDSIDGGAGTGDAVTINDDYIGGAALVFGAATMTNVEILNLGAGHTYDITTNNNTVANTATLTVNAATLGAGQNLTFNGGAETNGHFVINAGAGDDVLTGGSQSDTFDVSTGGSEVVYAGDGNDTVYAGAAFNSGDGYEGSNGYDTMVLAGVGAATYTGVNTLNLTSSYLDNFEQITVDGGGSYDIVLQDNVAASSTFTIDASGLLAADSLVFDGSAETLSSFTVLGGAHFDASDSIKGGDAYDTLLLNGDYTGANALVFGATTMTAFEQITCAAGHSYDLTTGAATIASGVYLYIDASALTAGQTLTFDGTANFDATPGLNGVLIIAGGAGDDVLLGGDANGLANSFNLGFGGNDTATGAGGDDNYGMSAALNAADTLDGAGGFDKIDLQGNYTGVNALIFAATTMVNIEYLSARGAFNYDLTTNDATVANGASLTVDASFVGAPNSFHFDGSAETNGTFGIIGSFGIDVLTGGALGDGIDVTRGTSDDVVYGGGGDDTIRFGINGFDDTGAFTAADIVDGGTGNDTVNVSGDYTGANAVVFGATTMINVENFNLFSGSGDFTTDDATVAAGKTLTVGCLGALTFDGSAETDGHFVIYTGTGPDPAGTGAVSDFLIGGALSDTFYVDDTTFHYPAGNDTVTGGGGGDTIFASSNAADSDTFVYNGVSDSTSVGFDTINNLNFDNDVFDISGFATLVTAIDAEVVGGTLGVGVFDTEMQNAIGAGQLGAHHAVLFHPDNGIYDGSTFLIVDINGTAGYQASADLVFDVTGFTGTVDPGDFI